MLTRTSDLLALRPTQLEHGGLLSPFQFITDGDEELQWDMWSSGDPSPPMQLNGRVYDRDQGLKFLGRVVEPPPNRTQVRTKIPLGPGALVNMCVVAPGSTGNGIVFARVRLIKGRATPALVVATLCQGYVTGEQDLAFPGSPLRLNLDARPRPRLIGGTDPPAGSGVAESVPTGAFWEPLAIAVTLVTDATVVERRPVLVLDDGTFIYAAVSTSDSIGASRSVRCTWAVGTPAPTFGTPPANMNSPMPAGVVMDQGGRLVIVAENFQAGDNFDQPRYMVREWLRID